MFYLPSRLRIRNLNATAYNVTYADKVLALPASTTILTEVTERFALFTEQEWNAMRVDHVDTGNVEFSWENIPLYSLYSCPVLFDADATIGGTDQVEVYNETGGTLGDLTTNRIVYLSGWDQTRQRFNIALADADSATVGARRAQYVLPAAIANNAVGSAVKRFRLTAVDVSAGAEGDPIYLSTTAGGWTRTAPAGADDTVQVIGRIAVVGVAGPPATGVIEFDVGATAPVQIAGRDIVPGAISADALGRALMATGFYDVATVLDKFATDSWANAALLQIIANGAFAADDATRALFGAGFLGATATGRALIVANFFDQATALDKFATDSIDNAVLLKAVLNGAFQADAGTRALFANDFVTPALVDEAGVFTWTGTHSFGGGLLSPPVAAGVAGYTFLATDVVVYGEPGAGNQTYALPAAATSVGRIILVKNRLGSAGVIRLDGNAAETVEGAATFDLAAGQMAIVYCVSAAVGWLVL